MPNVRAANLALVTVWVDKDDLKAYDAQWKRDGFDDRSKHLVHLIGKAIIKKKNAKRAISKGR